MSYHKLLKQNLAVQNRVKYKALHSACLLFKPMISDWVEVDFDTMPFEHTVAPVCSYISYPSFRPTVHCSFPGLFTHFVRTTLRGGHRNFLCSHLLSASNGYNWVLGVRNMEVKTLLKSTIIETY